MSSLSIVATYPGRVVQTEQEITARNTIISFGRRLSLLPAYQGKIYNPPTPTIRVYADLSPRITLHSPLGSLSRRLADAKALQGVWYDNVELDDVWSWVPHGDPLDMRECELI